MLESPRPRLLVADEHRIVAEGLTELLAGSYDVVEVVYDGDALLEAARRLRVDAILSEVTMPHRSGLAVLRQLRADASRVPFVFVTMHGEPAIAAAAMRAGASGYVLKASASTELIAALACVTQGATWISPSLAAESLGITQLQLRQLTGKQRDVLNRLSLGLSAKQLAHEMGLSVRTIEAHKYTMMHNLRVDTTFGLVRRARELGLLI